MRNILMLILSSLLVFSCTSGQKQNTYNRQGTVYTPYQPQHQRIIKRYPPPNTLERKNNVFRSFSSDFPEAKIALLVPLSGKYKDVGQSLLDAAQLALFSLDEPNLTLVPIDTKGTSYGAEEAAKKAVKEDVKLILGPLFGRSAKVISSIADENDINIVTFSNDRSLAGSGVYAIGFRPEQQIKRVVEYAMEQGVEDFTAVLPNNAYGATAAKELRETVAENNQASVLKTEIYRTSRSGKPLKLSSHVYSVYDSAINTKPPKDYNEELKAYNYNPIKYPRGMLIPEDGQSLEAITALLKKYGQRDDTIKLLGSSSWYTADTLKNDVLDGAWFAAPPRNRRMRFESKFEAIYGYKPAKLASLAYDAIALTGAIARISGNGNFDDKELTNPRGFYGVDGIFRFKDNGLTERGLAVIQIKDGSFEIVSPSPSNFVEVEKDSEEHAEE